MRRASTLATVLLIQAVGSLAGAYAAQPRVEIPPELILQRFTVAKDGEALLVPVTIDGNDHLFVVDTGAGKTFVDSSLLKGEPRGSIAAMTPHGGVVLKTYAPPSAGVGTLLLSIEGDVVAMDLEKFRQASGHRIEGILGLDFLGRYVLHIDFDRGELLFLKALPKDNRDSFPMFSNPLGQPEVDAFLTGSEKLRFMIDTGYIGAGSGILMGEAGESLIKQGKLRRVGASIGEGASGTHSSVDYQGSLLALGGFAVGKPVFELAPPAEGSGHILGLGFWSRFIVTFDFPGDRVFLARGRRFERPDRWDLSGLHFLKKNGSVVVDRVDSQSPGMKAGVQQHDTLIAIGDLKANEASLEQMRSRLRESGRMNCVVQRGGREHRLTLDLHE